MFDTAALQENHLPKNVFTELERLRKAKLTDPGLQFSGKIPHHDSNGLLCSL